MELSPQQLGQSLYRLGRQLAYRRHFDEARESFDLSLQFQPDSAETCFELGNLLHSTGRHAEAADRYARAIEIHPQFAEAWYNLGVVRMVLRDLGRSRNCFEAALQIQPAYAEAHNNLAILMQAAGQMDQALEHYREAARLDPDFAEPQYNLGLVLQDRGEFEACASVYEGLLARRPAHVDARNNLGNVLLELGRPSDAKDAYAGVLERDPRHPEANWNLGLAQLTCGEWRDGWANYEWRFRQSARKADDPMMPRWDGRALEGRRILLTAEQGLGDMLQFLRYVPSVVARGGRVLVECHLPLTGIVGRVPGVEAVVRKGDVLPEHDCWAPLLSLPFLLGMEAPPRAPMPYVTASEELVKHWSGRLRALGCPQRPRIGLTWSGNPQFKGNAKRTLAPANVRDLTMGGERQDRVFWINLQKGVPPVEGAPLVDLGDDGSSLEDVAAIIRNLDLVISVDTSVAHLAGALARPAWVMLAHAADWRWMTRDRTDSPWYPSMRLFRQEARGDWRPVIDEVGRQLDAFLAGSGGP